MVLYDEYVSFCQEKCMGGKNVILKVSKLLSIPIQESLLLKLCGTINRLAYITSNAPCTHSPTCSVTHFKWQQSCVLVSPTCSKEGRRHRRPVWMNPPEMGRCALCCCPNWYVSGRLLVLYVGCCMDMLTINTLIAIFWIFRCFLPTFTLSLWSLRTRSSVSYHLSPTVSPVVFTWHVTLSPSQETKYTGSSWFVTLLFWTDT